MALFHNHDHFFRHGYPVARHRSFDFAWKRQAAIGRIGLRVSQGLEQLQNGLFSEKSRAENLFRNDLTPPRKQVFS